MGLLLANPVSRREIVVEKAVAMVAYAAAFGVITALGSWVGVLLAGQHEISFQGIVSTSLLLTLFGLLFGGVALLTSAATGRTRMANWVTTGVAIATWFMFTFLSLSESTDAAVSWSPFQWYLGGDPMANGMDWIGATLLAGSFVALLTLSIPLFQRRDLRG